MEFPTPTKASRCYDNTKLSGYKTCPRFHFIRQTLGWRKVGTGTALVFGSAWHGGQDELWANKDKYGKRDLAEVAHLGFVAEWEKAGLDPEPGLQMSEQLAPRTPSIAREMYHEYVAARWKMLQGCEVLAVEQPFAVPLPDMEDFWYVGRLDKVIQHGPMKLIIEHKTTTAYATIGNFRTDYIDSWFSDSQVKGYQFGGQLYYPGLDAVWVDAALVHKKIHNAFRLVPVAHSVPLLVEWVGDAKQWAIRVSEEEDKFRRCGELEPGDFPKNENSCFGKYGSCSFIDICRTTADPSKLDGPPEGFMVDPWEPYSMFELDKIIKEPGEVT